MVDLVHVRGLEKTSERFRLLLVDGAEARGLNPSFLATCMSFETLGTFSPRVENPLSHAIGLIQFTGATAHWLGTTRVELAQMSAEEQLGFVWAYFDRVLHGRKIETLSDHYAVIFCPINIGKPNGACYRKPSLQYEQNKGLDTDGDGVITMAEAAAVVQRIYNDGMKHEPIAVVSLAARILPSCLLLLLGGLGLWLNR